MINVVDPKVGDTVYDGAVGSAGFLCEAFEYMSKQDGMTTSKMKTLQEKTFYGKEKKSLAYVIAVMNMILHGIDAPNILHSNTLGENISLIQEKDRYNVVLANPPFGGKERSEVQQNFPIKSAETAYLFLQHFIKILKARGRGGVVIKNTALSNTDNASVALRRHLLETCNVHTILDLPSGAFQGAGVATVVLFFDKGTPTKKIWYYQLNVGRNMGKTNPLNDADLADFVKMQKTKKDSDNSWTIDISDIDTNTYELAVRNPNAAGLVELGTPREILNEIKTLDARATMLLAELSEMLK
jgi:type I restriction enzyme M protein